MTRRERCKRDYYPWRIRRVWLRYLRKMQALDTARKD